jgi:hypothetical protein
MFKHELPEYIPATVGIGGQYKAAIRRPPTEFTPLFAKGRIGTDISAERADRWFLATLLALYGRNSFKRGNLDAGRLNRLFDREIVPADTASFDATSGDAELRIEYAGAIAYLESMQ